MRNSYIMPIQTTIGSLRVKHAAQLFFLDTHRFGPDFNELKIDGLDTTQYTKIEKLKDGGKVFAVFTHTARMSSNVDPKNVIPIIDKFGTENVILLGLAPNNASDGVPNKYELSKSDTNKYNVQCLQLGWETGTTKFSKFQKENQYDINKIRDICKVEQVNQPILNNDPKPENNKPSCPFKFIRNNKGKFMFACATAIGIVVLCSKKPEILTNFKDLISKLCSSISGVFTGR